MACALLAGPGIATAGAQDAKTFEVPDQVPKPCLSYSQFEGHRLLIPHGLPASAATRTPGDDDRATAPQSPGQRERARLEFIDMRRSSALLAAQTTRFDQDGCSVIDAAAARDSIYLLARWLLEGRIAVRVGDQRIGSVEHRPQRDVQSAGITGGFRARALDGASVPVLVMPPIIQHRWAD